MAPSAAQAPDYDTGPKPMLEERAPRAEAFAVQVIDTVAPFLSIPIDKVNALDIGCGYGHTAIELAKRCKSVVAIEPNQRLADFAKALCGDNGLKNIEVRQLGIESLDDHDVGRFHLVILDNVLEHLPDHGLAFQKISLSLCPGGVAFVLVPNRLWPIEVHYGLPFLSYLPLRLANLYLKLTQRGRDYTDASYAPTYFQLNRLINEHPEITFSYVLPADMSLATLGTSFHYRVGAALLRRIPSLWMISKMFLLIGVKRA